MNGENFDFRSVRSAIAGHGFGGYSLRFGHQASNRNRLALYRAMTANSGAKMSVEIEACFVAAADSVRMTETFVRRIHLLNSRYDISNLAMVTGFGIITESSFDDEISWANSHS